MEYGALATVSAQSSEDVDIFALPLITWKKDALSIGIDGVGYQTKWGQDNYEKVKIGFPNTSISMHRQIKKFEYDLSYKINWLSGISQTVGFNSKIISVDYETDFKGDKQKTNISSGFPLLITDPLFVLFSFAGSLENNQYVDGTYDYDGLSLTKETYFQKKAGFFSVFTPNEKTTVLFKADVLFLDDALGVNERPISLFFLLNYKQ